MKTTNGSRSSLRLAMCLAGLALAGCASSGGSKPKASQLTDKELKAQQVYMEGMTAMSPGKASTDRCVSKADEFKGKNWKQLVKHANGCAKQADWRNLEIVAQEIGRIEVNSPWGPYFYSLAAENTGDQARALWMIDLALKKSPEAPLFRYQKGRVLWRLKSYKSSVEEIAAAVKREPSLIDGHVFLAQIYHRDQNMDRALDHYQAALTQDGRNRACLEGLADIRFSQGKFDKAVEHYAEAVSQANDDFQLRVKLGQAHEAMGEDPSHMELALASYRAARELQKKGRGTTAELDLNEKIKTLESKVLETKTRKQAKLQDAPPAATGDSRQPAAPKKGGGK